MTKKKAKIAAPLKESELKDERLDKGLNQEIIRTPAKPKGRFQGRWNTGFNNRSSPTQLIRGSYKAQAEGLFRTADVGKVEAFRGSGHAKAAGKHVSADGLVARSGRRRIAPEFMLSDIHDRELWADRADQVADTAKEVLRGRNATVFEGRVIAPLRGDPKRSVEELAAQFGVSSAKIHKITERAKDRVLEVFRQRMAPQIEGDKCPRCGRVYADWNFSECGRNNGAVKDQYFAPSWLLRWATVKWPPRSFHPECLPQRYWGDAAALQKKYFNR
jgi:hypothetical protein